MMDHEKHEKHENLLFREEVFRIQGAVFEVSRQMGTGFLEAVYQECLLLELAAQSIPFEALPTLSLSYKGRTLKQTYRPDLVCFGCIIVELKVVRGACR